MATTRDRPAPLLDNRSGGKVQPIDSDEDVGKNGRGINSVLENLNGGAVKKLKSDNQSSQAATPHNEIEREMQASRQALVGKFGKHWATTGDLSTGERLSCILENIVAVNSHAYFHLLFVISVLFTAIFGSIWWEVNAEEYKDEHSVFVGFLAAFQLICTGGIDKDIVDLEPAIAYVFMSLFGVIIFAVLVGMITDSFAQMADGFSHGKTKVAESGHTLVLGWNEATVRLVCQIAFLRKAFRAQNDTWFRWLCPWARVSPSTPVARAPVVIMCCTKTKHDMQEEIRNAFEERGICTKQTRVGWDIICRVGDPADVVDLRRVGAHRATRIMVQMTERDRLESQNHDGGVQNGATLRTLLALRAVIFSSTKPDLEWYKLCIVVQLASPSKAIEAATFSCPDDNPLVLVQDLSVFMNSLMFTCVAQPGLADVLLDLLGFDEVAFRLKQVKSFPPKEQAKLMGSTLAEVAYIFEDAVILGVEQEKPPGRGEEDGHKKGSLGIAAFEPRLVKATDFLIFAAASPSPTLSTITMEGTRDIQPEPMIEHGDSTEFRHSVVPTTPSASSGRKCRRFAKRKTHVLVCGWREAWEDPKRFAERLSGTCKSLGHTSSLTYMNMFGDEKFIRLMNLVADEYENTKDYTETLEQVEPFKPISAKGDSSQTKFDFEPSQSTTYHWVFSNTNNNNGKFVIDIYYVKGDASVHEELKATMLASKKREQSFDQAVVLGTLVDNKHLNPESRDTRVMSIMLMMRYFVDKLGLCHIHIIGENALDSTAALAIAPRKRRTSERPGKEQEEQGPEQPDFVNVQAICARALCQGLSYPKMNRAIKELFSQDHRSPQIEFRKAEAYVPLDVEVSFAEVVKAVTSEKDCEHELCIGWWIEVPPVDERCYTLIPGLSKTCKFAKRDRLIIATRKRLKSSENNQDEESIERLEKNQLKDPLREESIERLA